MHTNNQEIFNITSRILESGKRLTFEAEEFLKKRILQLDSKKQELFIKRLLEVAKSCVFITIDEVRRVYEEVSEKSRKIDFNIEIKSGILDYKAVKMENPKQLIKNLTFRLITLRNDIIKNYKLQGYINVNKIPSLTGEYYVIGLVVDKKITKDKAYIEIEDLSGRIGLYLNNEDDYLKHKAEILPLDSVIAAKIIARRNKTPMLINILQPTVIPNKINVKNQDVYVILTSDFHIGSREFLYDKYEEFIHILRGETDDEKIKYIVSKIRCLIVAGDIVDGIGVYPSQEEDLVIEDIYNQYEEAYRLLRKLPSKIKIVVIPGNHDASTKAIPRPPIFKEYAEKMYLDNRFILCGDPAYLSVCGVNIFVSHGDFINDLFATTPGLTQEKVADALEILLSCRHMAPTYGLQTRIMPYEDDPLLIPEDVNILHCGHIHIFDYKHIGKDLLLVNSGTWQKQTKYQMDIGMKATPGIVPIVNLKDLKIHLLKLT